LTPLSAAPMCIK